MRLTLSLSTYTYNFQKSGRSGGLSQELLAVKMSEGLSGCVVGPGILRSLYSSTTNLLHPANFLPLLLSIQATRCALFIECRLIHRLLLSGFGPSQNELVDQHKLRVDYDVSYVWVRFNLWLSSCCTSPATLWIQLCVFSVVLLFQQIHLQLDFPIVSW